MNQILAWTVLIGLLVYMVVELGWGGNIRDAWMWPVTSVKRKPIWWIRWRRSGLYPPEPRDDTPKQPKPIKPKTPELVDR